MFEKQEFTKEQVITLFRSAERSLAIAKRNTETEVEFTFAYNALIKIAIAVCALNGVRVKSQQGHHIELLRKLSEFLKDDDVELIGNEMRMKRNWGFYDGDIIVSDKEAKEYLNWMTSILERANKQSRLF
ncbi:MAG: hypothetical protein AAB920_02875 [Patescibacteria group bacterium]